MKPMGPVTRSWALLAALGAVGLLRPLAGCLPSTDDDGVVVTNVEQDVLEQIGPGVILPALEDFRPRAVALRDAAAAWEVALTTDGDADAARTAAQEAWRQAMASWQRLEVMQIGPAGSSLNTVAGEDLRDSIYSWPTVNRCRVDQVTVTQDWKEDGFAADARVDLLGLAALEALLFAGDENGCPPQTEPNASGAWEALGPHAVAIQRAQYAVVLVDAILVTTDKLIDAWSADGRDFGALLAAPGSEGSPYATAADSLDAVLRGLFYVELTTKDRKLATLLGIAGCPTETCPDSAETRLSGTSHLWVAENLRGFRALFTGGDGPGFDDLLADHGEQALSDDLLAKLDAADAAAVALTTPIDVAAGGDDTAAVALHGAVKAVTDLLKGDVATVLSLRIPAEASGDND